ncbi:hypothetical protein [Archangium violaceum]
MPPPLPQLRLEPQGLRAPQEEVEELSRLLARLNEDLDRLGVPPAR